MDGGVE